MRGKADAKLGPVGGSHALAGAYDDQWARYAQTPAGFKMQVVVVGRKVNYGIH